MNDLISKISNLKQNASYFVLCSILQCQCNVVTGYEKYLLNISSGWFWWRWKTKLFFSSAFRLLPWVWFGSVSCVWLVSLPEQIYLKTLDCSTATFPELAHNHASIMIVYAHFTHLVCWVDICKDTLLQQSQELVTFKCCLCTFQHPFSEITEARNEKGWFSGSHCKCCKKRKKRKEEALSVNLQTQTSKDLSVHKSGWLPPRRGCLKLP